MLAIDGSDSTLASRVVLPLPRKPVTTVTGLLVRASSTILPVVRRRKRPRMLRAGSRGSRRPAGKLRRRGPQGAEILDQLGSSPCGRGARTCSRSSPRP